MTILAWILGVLALFFVPSFDILGTRRNNVGGGAPLEQ